jgi:tetratricopeptide (TPR) repeat protein
MTPLDDPLGRTRRSAGAVADDDTQPVPVAGRRASPRPWLLLVLAALAVGLVLLLAAGSGYGAGLGAAEATFVGQNLHAVEEQFNLGVEDLLAGRYDLASQRFAYVLSIDPSNADAAELLERANAALFVPTNTPGPTPTPITPTPTLDVGSLETLFGQVQSSFAQEDWNRVIEASLVIRQRDPQFRRSEIDVLLAQALRNRGVQRILSRQFELGLYDLALAERFGPLDGGAASWRNTAIFYTFANSFFVVDWYRSVENFSQLCAGGMWDSCSKYARAAMEVGHILLASATPCEAMEYYEDSLQTRANDSLNPTATYAARWCATQKAPTPTPTISSTWTLGPTVTPGPTDTDTPTPPGAPTDTPTMTLTPSLTPSPTETPSPTL